MRYIDADKLLTRVDCHGTNKFGMLDEDVREFIKAQPAEDVTPVIHAHWIENWPFINCSQCGKAIDIEYGGGYYEGNSEIGYEHIFPKYCGYCGAKMDEGE